MKTTTKFLEEVTYFDLESSILFNDVVVESSSRFSGKSFLNMYNLLGIKVTFRNSKNLRTKVKKGCNKGKTRITVYKVGE